MGEEDKHIDDTSRATATTAMSSAVSNGTNNGQQAIVAVPLPVGPVPGPGNRPSASDIGGGNGQLISSSSTSVVPPNTMKVKAYEVLHSNMVNAIRSLIQ
jgi:hypothetical protein